MQLTHLIDDASFRSQATSNNLGANLAAIFLNGGTVLQALSSRMRWSFVSFSKLPSLQNHLRGAHGTYVMLIINTLLHSSDRDMYVAVATRPRNSNAISRARGASQRDFHRGFDRCSTNS